MDDLISRQAALDALNRIEISRNASWYEFYQKAITAVGELPSAQQWIPCKTALPEINQRVILSLTDGTVMIGYQSEPDILWQVKDKRKKIWVYDPKSYTNDIDGLPTTKDCWFEGCNSDDMSYLSVTSPNYRKRFPGVIAWCPLPEPYKEHPDADHD